MAGVSVTEEFDYEDNPDRFRVNQEVVNRYGLVGDVHDEVAARVAKEALWPLLDMGCGEGRLGQAVDEAGPMVATDLARTLLPQARPPRVCSDMTRLPVPEGSLGSAAALWCLYHVGSPIEAIREAHRVLRPGGLFATCAPSIDNDPELAHCFPPPKPSPFDSEFGGELVKEVFGNVEADHWDMPAVTLPDAEAVALFLKGRGKSADEASELTKQVEMPVTLTKRGALFWAYKR
ncbi:TPA: hypothetical protein DCE37_21075 [Candidatus Latescibacteria bacterium]|nr:hypothetical protein [Candidatus Latescibacterota bacterium]